MVPETDARAILKGERISYWLGVGAQPSPKVATLIKKYGTGGSHLDAQKEALARLDSRRSRAIERAQEAAQSAPRGKSPAELAEEAAKAAAAAAAAEAAAAAAEAAAAPAEEAPAEVAAEEGSKAE